MRFKASATNQGSAHDEEQAQAEEAKRILQARAEQTAKATQLKLASSLSGLKSTAASHAQFVKADTTQVNATVNAFLKACGIAKADITFGTP